MMSTKTKLFTFTASELRLRLPSEISSLTAFDKEFQSEWQHHMAQGHFRYPFGNAEYRLLMGSKYDFVLQHIPDRASNRRTPQAMMTLSEPFDPKKFNFTKINEEKEVIFELKEEGKAENGARDLIVINVSPFELGASLLLPRMEECSSQILSAHSFALGLRTVLLSGTPELKLAFNSLCAYASVNHRHWHIYYLRGHQLRLESAVLEPLSPTSKQGVFLIKEGEYPGNAFVFQLEKVEDVERIAGMAFKLTNYLTSTNTAHNAFVTRAKSCPSSPTHDCIRIFIFARSPIIGSKDPGANSMAACELSGHILVYQEESFRSMTEEHLAEMQKEATEKVFNEVKEDVIELFQK